MAATTTPLLTALLKKSSLDDHDELLKASNAALKKSKSDAEAQHVKAVALLKLDQYDQAVKFIEDSGTNLREKASLEYAYALYKIGRLKEAAEVASKTKESGSQHVEAQARYRLEDTAATQHIYKDIKENDGSFEDYDIRVNQGAIDAQSQWISSTDVTTARRPGREDLEAFETAYNAACGSIARGELSQAELLLKRAKELCRHSDGLSEEQKRDELLPICVQQLFVLLNLNKTVEAEAIAAEINVAAISDLSTRSIAQHNLLIASSVAENPFLLYKTLNGMPKIPDNDRLFSYQSTPFGSNQRSIDLKCLKFDGVASSALKELLTSDLPSTSQNQLLSSVFNSAAHCRNTTGKAAIKALLSELDRRPNDVGLLVVLVQMCVQTGDLTSAIGLLESLFRRLEGSNVENEQNVRFNPGLVSILTSLYRAQGRKTEIQFELAKAARYWRGKPTAPASLLHAAGFSLLQSSRDQDIEAASEIYDKLYSQQPNDKATLAGYVASHAAHDSSQVSSLVTKLTPINDLTREIDVSGLEKAGIPSSSSAQSHAFAIAQLGNSSRKRAAPDGGSTKAKRLRKSKLPKDYDPNRKSDPERWLPARDRSTYRPPKSKRKGKKVGAGDDRTQGGAVNEDLNFDITSKPAVASSTANTTVGGGGGSGGAGNKKKKAKGKK